MNFIWDIEATYCGGDMSYKYVGKHGCDVALRMGYKEYPDENAYGDAYYIKDGLKWIFNITGLKKTAWRIQRRRSP